MLTAEDDGNVERDDEGSPDGLVEVGGLSAGRYTVFAYSRAHGFGVRRGVTPDGPPVEIALAQGHRVELHVTDEAGLPMVRRRVTCIPTRLDGWVVGLQGPDGLPDGHAYLDDIRTDAMGKVEVLVPAGCVELRMLSDRLESGTLALDTSRDGDQAVIALGP